MLSTILLFPCKAFSSFSIFSPFCFLQAQTRVIQLKLNFSNTIKQTLVMWTGQAIYSDQFIKYLLSTYCASGFARL